MNMILILVAGTVQGRAGMRPVDMLSGQVFPAAIAASVDEITNWITLRRANTITSCTRRCEQMSKHVSASKPSGELIAPYLKH
jgi:hypothetical protein